MRCFVLRVFISQFHDSFKVETSHCNLPPCYMIRRKSLYPVRIYSLIDLVCDQQGAVLTEYHFNCPRGISGRVYSLLMAYEIVSLCCL